MKDKQSRSDDAPHGRDSSDQSHESAKTGSGREAIMDAPNDHPQEHQSNYGGGGEHGGANKE